MLVWASVVCMHLALWLHTDNLSGIVQRQKLSSKPKNFFTTSIYNNNNNKKKNIKETICASIIIVCEGKQVEAEKSRQEGRESQGGGSPLRLAEGDEQQPPNFLPG